MPAATVSERPDARGSDATQTSSRDASDRLAGTPTTLRDVGVAAGIALVVMVCAWVWRSPIVPTDPWHYVQRALDFPDRVWIPLGYTRYGLIMSNILPAGLFGNAEATYYFWPLISAGVLAAVVYLMGRRWWGPVAGVVAVVVLFTNSIVFYNLTRQYPDVMSMTLVFVGAFCALMARDRGFRGRAAVLWILAAGFCLGWAFEVRETALFAWPLVIAILCRRGSALRVLGIAVLPVLGWAALDVVISGVAYGDPLLKPKTLMGFGAGRPLPEDPTEAAVVAARSRLDYLLAIPSKALATRPDGLWMVVTGGIAILVIVVRNWPLRLMSASFISVLLLNLAAGGVLLPNRPFGDLYNIRYWIQYVPSLALVIGGLTGLLVAQLRRRMGARRPVAAVLVAVITGLAVCAVPVWVTVRTVPGIEAFALNGGDALEELRGFAETNQLEGTTVWTDVRTVRLLPIFQRGIFGGDKVWTGKAKRFPKDPSTMRSGDLVLLYSAYDDTCLHCRIQVDPWLDKHPGVQSSWDLIYRTQTGNAELYRVR